MPLPNASRASSSAIYLQARMPNLGDAAGVVYFAAPESGYIKEMHVARGAAGGAGTTDLQITTQLGAVTPVMTMVTGGAAGDVDSLELGKEDTNNYVVAGEGFQVDSDGDFAGTPEGQIVIVLEPY
jgi:hypothetical protein